MSSVDSKTGWKMGWVKRLGVGLVTLVLLVGAARAALPWCVDLEGARARWVQAVNERIHGSFAIERLGRLCVPRGCSSRISRDGAYWRLERLP